MRTFVVRPRNLTVLMLWMAAGVAAPAWAQKIYTCVDKNGRRLTSDRPILECIDREQRELNRSGVVQRVIPPSPSLEEKARAEAERKASEQARQRETEGQQRDRALVLRYPNKATHDRARADALAQVDLVIGGLKEREASLVSRVTDIDRQLAAFAQQADTAPALLRRQRTDTAAELAQQRQLLQQQVAERERVNSRFNSELARLTPLWSAPPGR
jgi:hypothetical protein